jgi:hypothetical protein
VPITSFFIAFPHFSMLEFRRTIRLHLRPHQAAVKKRRKGDIGIEHFRNASGPLPKVTPDHALNRYAGGRAEAERALLAVFQITNKGIAHITGDLIDNPEHGRLIEIASRGVPSLVISYLYTPLGLPPPDYKLTGRRPED